MKNVHILTVNRPICSRQFIRRESRWSCRRSTIIHYPSHHPVRASSHRNSIDTRADDVISRFYKTFKPCIVVLMNGHSDAGMTVKCRVYDSLHEMETCLSEEMSKFLWRLVAFACDPRSPKFMQSPPIESYRGWWTIPYFSCKTRRWLISYSVNVKPQDVRPGLV